MEVSIRKDGRAASILAPHCLPEKGCKDYELEFHDDWERRGKPHLGLPSLSAGPRDRAEAKTVVPCCFPELFQKEKFLLLCFEKTKGFQDFGIKQTG